MALIVQDDTGEIVGANGYISVAFFKSYHTDLGVVDVVEGNFDDVDIESGIVRATAYADNRFRSRLKGCKWKAPSLQTTEFPRLNICDSGGFDLSETIPVILMKAIAEYALIAQLGALTVTPTFDETGQIIKKKKEVVDVLEEETEYHGGNSSIIETTKRLPQADFIMSELLKRSGRVIRH